MMIILIVLNKISIFETSNNFIISRRFWAVHVEQQQVEVCGILPPGGDLGFCMQDLEPVF